MARVARGEVFDPREVFVLHWMNRCVSAWHFCGCDPLTGIDYDHRKLRVEQRLQFLAGCCQTPETSQHTSAQRRIDQLQRTPHLAPILQRLGIVPEGWYELATGFGRLFHRVAGRPASVAREAARRRGSHRFRNPGGRLLDAARRHG